MAKVNQPSDVTYTSVNGELHVTLKFSKQFAQKMNNRLDFIQRVVDQEVIKQTTPYVPYQTGMLAKSAVLHTVIGSGRVVYATPYARYLYYGIKYAPSYPITKQGVLVGFYSPPQKFPTSIPLKYNKSFHPLAGAFWFERMKADKKDVILQAAQRAANM